MLVVENVKPDIALVAVVIVTSSFGFTQGIVWAFVAGTVANLLIPAEPLGSLPLALLAVAALVAAGATLLGRIVWVYPIAATFAGSVVADFIGLAALTLVGGSLGVGFPIDIVVPAAVYNAAIAGVVLIPTRLLLSRYRQEERTAW